MCSIAFELNWYTVGKEFIDDDHIVYDLVVCDSFWSGLVVNEVACYEALLRDSCEHVLGSVNSGLESVLQLIFRSGNIVYNAVKVFHTVFYSVFEPGVSIVVTSSCKFYGMFTL